MKCPKCDSAKDVIRETRESADHALIRRRRECVDCHARFTTYERIDSSQLVVIKRDGRREMFDLDKLRRGVAAALENLEDVTGDGVVEELVNDVAASLRPEGHEVTSEAIGAAVEAHLRVLSPVAFVRFASVYRRFGSANDFVAVIDELGAADVTVRKRDGRTRPFDRQKIVDGITWAVNGTPLDGRAEDLAAAVVDEVARGRHADDPISTTDIGEAVERELRDRDAVAFVRFSSVFRRFATVQDFARVLSEIGVAAAPDAGPPLTAG